MAMDAIALSEDDHLGPPKIRKAGAVPLAGVQHLDLARDIERIHRRYLDLLRAEMAKIGVDDISPAQVLMLFTIGDDELSVRDLLERGNYLGSNASYNLKQLGTAGYINREASSRDRRSARISLTRKGRELCKEIRRIDNNHQRLMAQSEADTRDLEVTARTLRKVEVMFITAMRYGEVIRAND